MNEHVPYMLVPAAPKVPHMMSAIVSVRLPILREEPELPIDGELVYFPTACHSDGKEQSEPDRNRRPPSQRGGAGLVQPQVRA